MDNVSIQHYFETRVNVYDVLVPVHWHVIMHSRVPRYALVLQSRHSTLQLLPADVS